MNNLPNELVEILAKLKIHTNPEGQDEFRDLCKRGFALLNEVPDARNRAILQGQLAYFLYRSRSARRAHDIDEAIAATQLALEAFARKGMEGPWVVAVLNQARAYSNRVLGDRKENLEAAIGYYTEIISFCRRQSCKIELATACDSLAQIYTDVIFSDRSNYYDLAIACCDEALTVWKRDQFPKEFASSQRTRAIAFINRLRGDPKYNLSQAITSCEEALAIPEALTGSSNRGKAHYLLGTALSRQVYGQVGTNIEQAILHFNNALRVFEQEGTKEDWAITTLGLGTAYRARLEGNHDENVDEAIRLIESALESFAHESMAFERAHAYKHLGNAYFSKSLDREISIKNAIIQYEKAIPLFKMIKNKLELGSVYGNLSAAYMDQSLGSHKENELNAVGYGKDAVRLFSREDSPYQYAMAQNTLANAYAHSRHSENRQNSQEEAIRCYEEALEAIVPKGSLPWANICMNLGNAYQERLEGDRQTNLNRAISQYENASTAITRDAMPLDWARLQMNLANAFGLRSSVNNRKDDAAKAIMCYAAALEVRTKETMPLEFVSTQINLGNTYFREERWDEAASAFRSAMATHQLLYRASPTPATRWNTLHMIGDVPSRLAYALGKSGTQQNLCEAIVAVEVNRGRFIANRLRLEEVALDTIRPEDKSTFERIRANIHSWHSMINSWNPLVSQDTGGNDLNPEMTLEISRKLTSGYAELDELIRRIKLYQPGFLADTSVELIREVSSTTQLIYLVVTELGGVAFVANGENDFITQWFPSLTKATLQEKSLKYFEAYNFRSTYPQGWLDALSEMLDWMWQAFMEVLVTVVAPEAIIIPSNLLSLLPLHAARTRDSTCVTGWRYALDFVRLRYAPSALVLSNALKSSLRDKSQSLFIVGDPQPTSSSLSLGHLDYCDLEVSAVENHFKDRLVIFGSEATKEAVVAGIPGRDILHFACHGMHDFGDPLNSGLVMAHDEILSLRDILTLRLPGTRLAVLSACSSGIPGTMLPDEYVSLPGGMMLSGVDGVIASLWPVGDVSTMMLMIYFYEQWQKKEQELPLAFSLAQKWLRDSTNAEKLQFIEANYPQHVERFKVLATSPSRRRFESPNSWAPFTYTGI
jgi:CHAT domain-containing protein/tetratricopeptide (TPR) repeat protein